MSDDRGKKIRERLAAGVPGETIAWDFNLRVSEIYRLAEAVVCEPVPQSFPPEPESGVRKLAEVVRLPVVYPDVDRPKTRGDCKDGPRPCPFAGCAHHLGLDVRRVPQGHSVKHAVRGLDPDELPETCALDVADRGGVTLDRIADIYGQTRERIRQIETKALDKIRRTHPQLAEALSDLVAAQDERHG